MAPWARPVNQWHDGVSSRKSLAQNNWFLHLRSWTHSPRSCATRLSGAGKRSWPNDFGYCRAPVTTVGLPRSNVSTSKTKYRPILPILNGSRSRTLSVSEATGTVRPIREDVEITAEELARVASAAEAAITLILELLNSKAAHLNYQADHTGWVVKVCGLIVSSRVRLLFNIYRMRIMEGDRDLQTFSQVFVLSIAS